MDLLYKEYNPVFGIPLRRVLDFFWLSGLASGAAASIYAGDSLVSMMRAASVGCVSISGLLSVLVLPLLFSAFAVYIRQIRLLFPIIFIKAFSFSFVSMALDSSFGSAGWLMRILLPFGTSVSLPVLWWFWNRSITSRQNQVLTDFVAALSVISVAAAFDYWLIVPFLADLISQ